MADKCKECGCICKQCNKIEQKHNDMHLHVEIENLRQRLLERDSHIVTMETQFLNEAEKFPNGEIASLREELLIWQDKYSRLYDAHKRVQKVNQNLEDKLLKIVDKCETEKGAFTKDIATLSHRLADANYTIHRLTQDNEKYRTDVNLAIQLLQCKPSSFIGQKYETLPPEVQAKVRSYVTDKNHINEIPSCEVKSITVPISTFPPTAMVYNVAKPVLDKQDNNSDDDLKPPVDIVSAAIMAKVLEDREKEKIFARHCITCTCHRSVLKVDTETQTLMNQEKCKSSFAKDYFKPVDSNELKISKRSKDLNHFDVKGTSSKHSQGNTLLNSVVEKRTAKFHFINEVAETKNTTNSNSIKGVNKYNSNAKNYANLRDLNKQSKSTTNEANVNDNCKLVSKEENLDITNDEKQSKNILEEKNSFKDVKTLSDQAKIDMINERLWKSNWMNSKDLLNSKDNEVQLEVINERAWKNSSSNSSKSYEKPVPAAAIGRLTVIEVKSADDSTNHSEKTNPTTETAASPSFSGESILISSSDPSSLSSDALPSSTNQPISNKKERVSGPRNCLMRVTPGSKNILLDNVGAYETVLYTSGCSRPNTALVHLAKSSRSGRSPSISSEENSPCTIHDHTTHLRVAQWVDTLANNCDSQTARVDASSEDPLLSDDVKSTSQAIKDVEAQQPLTHTDLMTFEGSSDEEHRLGADYLYQDNISKEIEETYFKLAASLDSACSQRAPGAADFGMMTIEQYRNEQKRSHKSSQAKLQSKA